MLRPWWSSVSPDLLSHLGSLEQKDRERRERAVSERLVLDCHIPPRRVWDLYSNRVLPFWVLGEESELRSSTDRGARSIRIQTVSHAWMSPERRIGKSTPINGEKWPVPIPQDIRLDDLRIELLNLLNFRLSGHTEYVWLDVLCLRQVGGKPMEESLRAKEWEIDVPTIGAIYRSCWFTVFYLNGLGRPFEENDLDDARHWFNRAWTMQEWCHSHDLPTAMGSHMLLGGVTENSPRFYISRLYSPSDDYTKRLSERMSDSNASAATNNILKAAAMMNRRKAEREVDKLAGLAYFVCGETQPVFDATKSVEDAWRSFIDCLIPRARAQLLFIFPVAGDGDFKWTPSWQQLLGEAEPVIAHLPLMAPLTSNRQLPDEYYPTIIKDGYSCLVLCLPSCRLNGFDSPHVTPPHKGRRGTVTFRLRQTDNEITFQLIAYHSHPIPSDRTYCLLSSGPVDLAVADSITSSFYWVVGFLDEEERFHKVTVLEFDHHHGGMAMHRKLCKALGLSKGDNEETNIWMRKVKLA
ncbi:hypothetical protein PENSPDRAFT_708710 [Peniophora sp. CONT]|nr:hypothetical protein PENSPDRAFT_708710 [Peniophora sp. CONT]